MEMGEGWQTEKAIHRRVAEDAEKTNRTTDRMDAALTFHSLRSLRLFGESRIVLIPAVPSEGLTVRDGGMAARNFLAFDLGAESGRAVLGTLEGDRLALAERHRFGNPMGRMNGHLHWNLLSQWEELKTGLRNAGVEQHGDQRTPVLPSLGFEWIRGAWISGCCRNRGRCWSNPAQLPGFAARTG